MKRLITGLLLVLMSGLGSVAPARATGSDASPLPKILGARWQTWPLHAGDTEVLKIRAVDRDGIISQVNIFWGDNSFAHADLICLEQGQVAEVLLDHEYRQPGKYRVRVEVGSTRQCFGPANQWSPGETVQAAVG